MRNLKGLHLSRRTFLTATTGLFAGRYLISGHLDSTHSVLVQPGQQLRQELTPEELKWVEKSSMAKDVLNYYTSNEYICSESLLIVSLKYLKKPEELVWIASGFGGGMYHKNLCGLLTAGVMAIGLSAGMLEGDRKEAKDYCKQFVKEYWKWWTSVASLKCSDIRKEGMDKKVLPFFIFPLASSSN